jgi:Limiting CO2-inducible proteins B/C beta carbonyic anhydrases
VKRVACALGTIALATSSVPVAAEAKRTVQVVKEVSVISPETVKLAGKVVGGGALALLAGKVLFRKEKDNACTRKIALAFPQALKNKDLVNKVSSALEKYGFGSDTLVATSFCGHELNRKLENDFAAVYDDTFNMGGYVCRTRCNYFTRFPTKP